MERHRPLWCALVLILVFLPATLPVAGNTQELHRAVLVVDFGDGRVVVRVVEFAEESITGVDLLQ
ncbi:MAG: hypothetical protein ACP5SI_01750, partial [Chloroflexia bacterium]